MPHKSHHGSRNNRTVLFKKLLSSFFSKEAMMQIGMNPASVFISFVSSRQFFGLINRRMTEHYKLNNLGINLESFDNKIGLGSNPTVTVKNIDTYYAYNSSANFVGYKSYNPNIIATGLSMFFAAQSVDSFEQRSETEFSNFIYTIYLLVFVFVSHIKTFPASTEEEQFDRFINIFRSFYKMIFKNTEQILKDEDLKEIQILLTNDLKTMFSLFHVMKLLSHYFSIEHSSHKEMMEWLLAGETQHHIKGEYVEEYLKNYEDLRKNEYFSLLEKKIIDLLIPADISIKYLFGDQEGKMIAQHILKAIFPPKKHEKLFENFIFNEKNTQALIEISTDFQRIKDKFFYGLQNYIKAKIKNFTSNSVSQSESEEGLENSLDEFLSYLSENDEINLDDLPKNIQVQSITFDKLVNFYISFVGGLWVARGESGFLRIHKNGLLQKLLRSYPLFGSRHDTIDYYARFFKLYEKNVFYYQYVFNHIRSGKENFILPSQGSSINHNSNLYVIQLLNESHRSSLLQDIGPSGIKLYIKKEDILENFKTLFGDRISASLGLSNKELIQKIYRHYKNISTDKKPLSDTLDESFNKEDIARLKDRMYSLDFWIVDEFIGSLVEEKISDHYDETLLLALYANAKETLFGFLLYLQYIYSSEQSHQKDYARQYLIDLYIDIVLQGNTNTHGTLSKHINRILEDYKELLSFRTMLDDNQDYMYIGFNNRNTWIKNHKNKNISLELTSEDKIRFIGYLKHITYYNRRFLIPQN